jgi:hypothetical protein
MSVMMSSDLLFGWAAIALIAATPAQDAPGVLVASDKELNTSVRLIEDDYTIRFQFTGPAYVTPSVAIDASRNGMIDPDVDFSVGFAPDGSPCLSQLLGIGRTSRCLELGGKAQVTKSQRGDAVVTVLSFQKHTISTDGFGFGFAISLWNTKGNFGTSVAGGDYMFGGSLHLVQNGPNFLDEGDVGVPAEAAPFIHRYEGCLSRAINALLPLNPSKLEKLKAVPMACAAERAAAEKQAVDALVAARMQSDEATTGVRAALDYVERTVSRLVQVLEKGR